MQKSGFLFLTLLLASASPALAEGFSQIQFAALIVVNLVLGAILALFFVILASVLLRKLKASPKVERRAVERESRA